MTSRPMLSRNLRSALVELGWPGRDLAADLRAFQAGYALGPALTVDGVNGPQTREAVRHSLREHRAGRPDASPHYRWSEFRCRCGGVLTGCRGVYVQRALLLALERYRQAAGRPVDVVSGYRCAERNRRVGGASGSQHLHGAAADVEQLLAWRRVKALGLFGGIGRSKRTGLVRHVDVRHVSGHDATGATATRPTVWDYSA